MNKKEEEKWDGEKTKNSRKKSITWLRLPPACRTAAAVFTFYISRLRWQEAAGNHERSEERAESSDESSLQDQIPTVWGLLDWTAVLKHWQEASTAVENLSGSINQSIKVKLHFIHCYTLLIGSNHVAPSKNTCNTWLTHLMTHTHKQYSQCWRVIYD